MPRNLTRAEKAEKAREAKVKKEEKAREAKRAAATSAARVKSIIATIGSNPFPVEQETSNFIKTMVNYPACASLIFMGHGGTYTEFNLTNPCLIPFYVLSLFTSYSSGFSTFSRRAHDPPNLLYHRMGKTLALNKVHEILQENNGNMPLTIKSLFKTMQVDVDINKIDVYQGRAMTAEYKLILAGAEAAGRDATKVGHYTGGNNSNQILYLCLGHMYNNSLVHDDFCGLFLKLYYYETLRIWTSSMNDNENPDSPATKNSIKFLENPMKLDPVSNIAGQRNTVEPALLTALLADLSSIEVLRKVKGMDRENTMLNLLMKILIARNVLFVSSCSGTPTDDLKKSKSHIIVTGTKINYDYLSLDNVLDKNEKGEPLLVLCKLSSNEEVARLQGGLPEQSLTLLDNKIKIYRLTTEDTFFLMHFLSIISNQEGEEEYNIINSRTLRRIQTIMNQLTIAVYNLLIKRDNSDPISIQNYEKESFLLITLSIRLMNDSIMSNAYYTRRVMGFIQSACRPANTPAEEAIVKKATPYSQELSMQLSNDDEICMSLQPIEPPSIPITLPNNSFLLTEINKELNLNSPIKPYLVKYSVNDIDNYDRNDKNMDIFIDNMTNRNSEVMIDGAKSKMATEGMQYEEQRNEILTMFKTFDDMNNIPNIVLPDMINVYKDEETRTPISDALPQGSVETMLVAEEQKVEYGGRNKNNKKSKRRNKKTHKKSNKSNKSKRSKRKHH